MYYIICTIRFFCIRGLMENTSFRELARQVGILFDSNVALLRGLSESKTGASNFSAQRFSLPLPCFQRLVPGGFCLSDGGPENLINIYNFPVLKVLEKPRDGILKYNLVVDIIFIVNNYYLKGRSLCYNQSKSPGCPVK